MPIHAAGTTDPGKRRDSNEDSFLVDTENGLFIVSDGMGGHAAGELASRLVVEALPGHIENLSKEDPATAETLCAALKIGSEAIRDEAALRPAISGMGATVVCALVRDGRALFAHMGDSRLYLSRHSVLAQQTVDHTIVQLLVETGDLTPAEAKVHPARSRITRYMGMKGEALPETGHLELFDGDRLLLCTDGLTGMLDDAAIEKILLAEPEPASACRALIHAANRAGGMDNVTVVLADWTEEGKS